MKKNKKGFSKKLLIADYIIAIIMIVVFFVCVIYNGVYISNMTNNLLEIGMDISMANIADPISLDIFGVFLNTWIGQLAISTYAFYSMTKSEHKIQLPMILLEDLPQDIKDNVDMTQIITTVLSCTDN